MSDTQTRLWPPRSDFWPPNSPNWPQCIENHTYLPFALSPSGLVFDLGLNEGRFSSEIIRQYSCEVIGCEPVGSLHRGLPRLKQLTALRAAAGGEDGEAEIQIYEDHCASLNAMEGGVTARTETVDVLSFRSLMEKAGNRPVALMKIDIEGAECPLIEGASDEDLLLIDQYTIEFHDFIMPELARRTGHIIDRMDILGYRFIDFSRAHGDCLFIKSELLGMTPFVALAGPYKYAVGTSRVLTRLTERIKPRKIPA
jgi:FkbM family methyltransferase